MFNTLTIPIRDVAGLNDVLGIETINGFCGTCHDSPNVGDHSVRAPLNIGLVDVSRRTPDLPLVTVMCNATGKIVQVTDLARPSDGHRKMRGYREVQRTDSRRPAGRAPYFHNRSAATLLDTLDFYDTRFSLNLSQRDKNDLVAFLKTL